VACERGDALAGAVPTKSDAAAGIPFEVRISSAERPSYIALLAPMSPVESPEAAGVPGSQGSGHDGSSRGGMIGDLAVETQSAEPTVGQIEVDSHSPFGTNAEAVADKRHPDHQLRISRGPPDLRPHAAAALAERRWSAQRLKPTVSISASTLNRTSAT
jgi:hypothetical protein